MKACKDCPFKRSSELLGSPEWLTDVFKFSKQFEFFPHTCHKTDPKADGYKGAKKVRECAGHVQMLMNKCDGTPGRGGVYNDLQELIEIYLVHWLGAEKVQQMRSERDLNVRKK